MPAKKLRPLTNEEYRAIARIQPTTVINLDTAYLVKSVGGKGIEIEYAVKLTDVLEGLGVL